MQRFRRRFQLRRRSPWPLFLVSLGMLVASVLVLNRGPVHPPHDPQVTAQWLAAMDRAVECAESEARSGGSGSTWVGEYYGGELPFRRPTTRLVLGAEHYAILQSNAVRGLSDRRYGPDRSEALVECGSVERNGECCRFQPDLLDAHVLPRSFVWIECGETAHLATVDAIPALFLGERAWSSEGHSREIRLFTRGREHIGCSSRPKSVPETYEEARRQSLHVRLLECPPPAGDRRCWRAVFAVPGGTSVPTDTRLWWDGEACSRVCGFVETTGPTTCTAVLDAPDEFDFARLNSSSTFSALPRLQ